MAKRKKGEKEKAIQQPRKAEIVDIYLSTNSIFFPHHDTPEAGGQLHFDIHIYN